MEKREIEDLIQEIIKDRGVPRNIKTNLEESLGILSGKDPDEEKIATITSILDDASSDPNVSFHTRTKIWGVVSVLEELRQIE